MHGPSLLVFRIPEPFDAALRMTRAALERQGLRCPAELDLSARLRQELGASLAQSVVLWVDDPALLLEASVFHRGAGLLMPQPLVIAADQRGAEAWVRNANALPPDVPHSMRAPLLDLLRRMCLALETIAERQLVVA